MSIAFCPSCLVIGTSGAEIFFVIYYLAAAHFYLFTLFNVGLLHSQLWVTVEGVASLTQCSSLRLTYFDPEAYSQSPAS